MSDNSTGLSSQEMEERFDLLATDAKEYAVFLVDLTVISFVGMQAQNASSAFGPKKSLGSTSLGSLHLKAFVLASPSMNLSQLWLTVVQKCLLAGPEGRQPILVSGNRDGAAEREQTGSLIRQSDA